MTDAPSNDARPAPIHRGLGILAGVMAFVAVGIADGIVALTRLPPGAMVWWLRPLVVFHCVAILVTTGFGWGLVGEAVLAVGRRVPLLARFGAWVAAGPRRWFARDPSAAHIVLNAVIGGAVIVGPVFPATYLVVTHFHSHPLMALAVMLTVLGALAVAGLVVVLLAPALQWVLARARGLASPGFVAVLSLVVITAQSVRFCSINWQWMQSLDWGAGAIELALLVGNLAALVSIGAWRARKGRPLSRAKLASLVGVSLALFALSAFSFGARQTVAMTVFTRSVVSRHFVRALQRVVDLDRDGYSALFNGGDCNDRNARIHPGAFDVPGNGIDENCTGHDAISRSDDGDGRIVPLPEKYSATRPSIVLLSIDALRPDHMGCYGYRRPTTPNLDAFSAEAARFTHAYTASPRSLRSFATIWTGRYASQVRWGTDQQYPALEQDNATLAELLHDAGYATAMFNNANYFSRTAGFFQGFDENHETRGGAEYLKDEVWPTVDAVANWIRGRGASDQPFFLWTHIMEPHDPYRDLTEPQDFGHGLVDRYDEEVARADLAARRILDAVAMLQNQRPDRNVVVFIIGDHGEAHGEHGVLHHSFDLHDEALRVPLIVHGPGIPPGTREPLASLMDLYPTILNLAGLRPPSPVPSLSLVGPIFDPTIPFVGRRWRDRIFAEVTPDGVYPSEHRSLYQPPWKLLWDVRVGTWELYDIAHDPGETRNLFDARHDVAARLRDTLTGWMEGTAASRSSQLIDACRLSTPPVPQHPLRVRFGDVVELLGYDMPDTHVPIGRSVRLSLYYRVLQRTDDPHWMLVAFEPDDNQPIWPMFRARHYPMQGRYPTTRWVPGELLRDEVSLLVEREMRPVLLHIRFGVETDAPNSRLAPSTGGRADRTIDLGTLEITPAIE